VEEIPGIGKVLVKKEGGQKWVLLMKLSKCLGPISAADILGLMNHSWDDNTQRKSWAHIYI
jgi:hypothetical protein